MEMYTYMSEFYGIKLFFKNLLHLLVLIATHQYEPSIPSTQIPTKTLLLHTQDSAHIVHHLEYSP